MKLGKYLHYKGKEYEVIGIARDSEALEEVVVYKALYDSQDFGMNALWIRKKEDFEAKVNQDGIVVQRFIYIGNQASKI
ncbi:MAG: DUF1653 domain-containing protein [Patescibacteria group bacterium]|nr:DUF1653 domain-containing protein [Patescibacteria group bacterium]MBU2509506.1 DUF1653 domain-containing protein [Patescibacteria group bacterium]